MSNPSTSGWDSSSGLTQFGIGLANTVQSELKLNLPLPSLPIFCGAAEPGELKLFDEVAEGRSGNRSLNLPEILSQSSKIANLLEETDVSYLHLLCGDTKMATIETGQKTQKPSPSSSASAAATLKQPSSSFIRWGRRGRRHPFVRKQLRGHLDLTGWKWVRPENKELSKTVFSSGTMVELRRSFAWRPAMIIWQVDNGKSYLVKLCNGKSEIVDSRILRPKQPFFSVGEYELLDHVEVFDGSVWRDGVVRGIVYEGRYMVSFGKAKVASAQFNYSDLRPPMEWEDGIWHQRPKTKSRKDTPSDFKCYSRKRKRGEADHNSNLNNTVLSSDRAVTVVKESAANVEDTQAKDTPIVLPFAKKSPVWKLYEAMEVFRKVPQNPHFSPLIKSTSEDFREGSALGMMASFSGLLEKLKDLETDFTVSQLGSLKESFTKLDKYGFDVTRPLSRIKKLLALKDRQLNILEKRKGLDKKRRGESSKRRKMLEAALKLSETERKMLEVKQKILELQRQEAALKEQKVAAEVQKNEAYLYILQMESGARDLDLELEDVEFDFETMLSAPW